MQQLIQIFKCDSFLYFLVLIISLRQLSITFFTHFRITQVYYKLGLIFVLFALHCSLATNCWESAAQLEHLDKL